MNSTINMTIRSAMDGDCERISPICEQIIDVVMRHPPADGISALAGATACILDSLKGSTADDFAEVFFQGVRMSIAMHQKESSEKLS
jgi:hypothetical protein